MGFWSDIYHGSRAEALEKKGDYDGAVRHVLQSGFESWERKQRAGDILKRAGRFRDAIRYYREAMKEDRYGSFWESGTFRESIEECYEALGEYSELMEIYFEEWGRRQHFGTIYEQYKKCRAKSSSFRLSHSRLKEMYTGLCRKWASYADSAFSRLSEDEKARVIDEMEKCPFTSQTCSNARSELKEVL